MKKSTFFFLIFSMASSFVFSIQQQNLDLLKPEQHKVTVRLVLVDVIALDKEGKNITDLTKDDFEIWDERKKVEINSLDLISYQIVEAMKKEQAGEEEVKGQPTVIKRRSKFFVVFDSINTVKRMLDRRKPELTETLSSLVGLGHEIMILELSTSEGIKVLQNLTSDKQLIAQAIQKASGNIWIERASDTLSIPNIIMLDPEVRKAYMRTVRAQYQYETRIRFEKTISNLLSVMNTIKDYPGRKPVLFISGGFPTLSFSTIYDALKIGRSDNFRQSAPVHSEIEAAKIKDPFRILQKTKRRGGSDIFADLINFANSFNISFYTLNPDDYLRHVLPDIAYDNYPRVVGVSDFSKVKYGDTVFYRDENAEIKKNELSNLKYLAKETGGEALQGGNKFKEFRKTISRDLSYYYELSFYPRNKKADEKYHALKVKVKRPGIEIRFRKGYYDYSSAQKESLLFASASFNPGLFKDISFQARAVPFIAGKEKFILWINLALPVKDLLLNGDPHEELKIIKIHFWVDNPQGVQAYKAQLNIPINLSESFRERLSRVRFFGYNTRSNKLHLDENQYNIIFTLYDEESDRVGTVEQTMKIPVLDELANGDITSVVFGHMVETGKKDRTFSISMKDGSLAVDTFRFHPMGTTQFNAHENIYLFLQVFSNEDKVNLIPYFELTKEEEVQGNPEGVLIKESWNKKAKVKNMIIQLNFQGFNKGEYMFIIKMMDENFIEKTNRKIKIKLL